MLPNRPIEFQLIRDIYSTDSNGNCGPLWGPGGGDETSDDAAIFCIFLLSFYFFADKLNDVRQQRLPFSLFSVLPACCNHSCDGLIASLTRVDEQIRRLMNQPTDRTTDQTSNLPHLLLHVLRCGCGSAYQRAVPSNGRNRRAIFSPCVHSFVWLLYAYAVSLSLSLCLQRSRRMGGARGMT